MRLLGRDELLRALGELDREIGVRPTARSPYERQSRWLRTVETVVPSSYLTNLQAENASSILVARSTKIWRKPSKHRSRQMFVVIRGCTVLFPFPCPNHAQVDPKRARDHGELAVRVERATEIRRRSRVFTGEPDWRSAGWPAWNSVSSKSPRIDGSLTNGGTLGAPTG